MDGFTYHDIFQTKGIEYLVIIAFLLILIPFWVIINRKEMIIRKIKETLGILTSDILKIPKGVFFSNHHTWAHLEKSGIAEVGLDDWLLHLAGEVEFSQIKEKGSEIRKGEILTQIVSKGRSLNIISPLSGLVIDTNPMLRENASIIGQDPYKKGWVYKIEPSSWKSETSSFYVGEEAKQWLKLELERFKDFISISLAKNHPESSLIIMQEGGELRDNPLFDLPKDVWQDFQKIFLENEI